MELKKIPESKKSVWRQFFQNARGRADLKQPAGFLALLTLLALPLILAVRTGLVPDSLIYSLAAVVVLWWVGDTTEAVAVLKALYGGFKPPEINNTNNIKGGEPTINQPGGEATPGDTCV